MRSCASARTNITGPVTSTELEDSRWLAAAASLAARARPLSRPNPAVGALIVREGAVVGRGWTGKGGRPHAETEALKRAGRGKARGATLYTTGEPCPMCMGAIVWCELGRVVYAASVEELSKHVGQIMITSRALAKATPFVDIEITGDVLAPEALALFSRK